MAITSYPKEVREGASSLVVFSGPPNVSVGWALAGSGTLTPGTTFTDDAGNAFATYAPGVVGETVTITVTYGT